MEILSNQKPNGVRSITSGLFAFGRFFNAMISRQFARGIA
jgi:hypothetical protein